MLPLPNSICPICHQPNECAAALTNSFDTPCWCVRVDIRYDTIAGVPDDQRNRSCVCRACATAVDRDSYTRSPP